MVHMERDRISSHLLPVMLLVDQSMCVLQYTHIYEDIKVNCALFTCAMTTKSC